MSRTPRVVTLCDHPLNCRHVCMFTESDEERYRILNPFLAEGLAAGEEVLTIVDAQALAEHAQRMQEGGVPVDDAVASGQLQLLASDDTYGRDGTFAAERMYALLEDVLRQATQGRWGCVRVAGDAGWILRNMQGSDELMAYEAKVNLLAPQHECTLVCMYDINQCSGQVIADALAPHSQVILGGRLHDNAHYVEPLEFLQKVALRRSRATPLTAPGA